MTAPPRSTPHSQLPASQTAPVAEFRCLYTPDIRKKQKKWHDGYLKFHSFNSRIMVYDQARNFLGDTYYKDSTELQEGDELTLDKGVMVEVADAIGVTQTDLKPLFEKKPREAPPPPSAPPRRFQPPSQLARPSVAPVATTATRTNPQRPRHKPLNSVLGTPKGPIGKAVPIKSPYEARQEKERGKGIDFAIDHEAKRRKTAHSSTSSATMRPSSPPRDETPAPKKSIPLSTENDVRNMAQDKARPVPRGALVVDLEDNKQVNVPASSNPSLPSTTPPASRVTSDTRAPPVKPAISEKPTPQTPKIPRGKVPVPSVKALKLPKAPAPPSSPPVSAANRVSNVDFAIQPTPAKASVSRHIAQPSLSPPIGTASPRQPKAKSLRLSKGVMRGTLMMCQQPPLSSRSRESSEARVVAARSRIAKSSKSTPDANPVVDMTAAIKTKREAMPGGDNAIKRTKPTSAPPRGDFDYVDNHQEDMLALMDQQLLVARTPSPEPTIIPSSPERILHIPKAARATNTARKSSPKTGSLQRSASPSASVITTSKLRQRPVQEHAPTTRKLPSQATVARDVKRVRSRVASPALSAVAEMHSRTTSVSPSKLAALSTGGFRKKETNSFPRPVAALPVSPTPAPYNDTVVLPPHPLRANKNGPVMTTIELAATLRQPRKRAKATKGLNEDEAEIAGVSPNRKFRRVRSENDAPIPSTSQDWEQGNLSNPFAAPDSPQVTAKKQSGLAALIKKTDPRKKLTRSTSLSIDSSVGLAQQIESPMVSPVEDKDVGPWSTDAFDLFDRQPLGNQS